MRTAGIDVSLVIGATREGKLVTEEEAAAARVSEIEVWLREAPAHGYNVETWAVIDDLDLKFKAETASGFVKTDVETGITEEDVVKLRHILMESSPGSYPGDSTGTDSGMPEAQGLASNAGPQGCCDNAGNCGAQGTGC